MFCLRTTVKWLRVLNFSTCGTVCICVLRARVLLHSWTRHACSVRGHIDQVIILLIILFQADMSLQ